MTTWIGEQMPWSAPTRTTTRETQAAVLPPGVLETERLCIPSAVTVTNETEARSQTSGSPWCVFDGKLWLIVNGYVSYYDGTTLTITNTLASALWVTATGNRLIREASKVLYHSTNGTTWTECSGDHTLSTYGTSMFSGFASNGTTCMLSEYSQVDITPSGRYVYRSTDDGVTWARVLDLGALTPQSKHCHCVGYHAGSGRWLVGIGDSTNRRIMYSADGGSTWTDYQNAGLGTPAQPTSFVDYGDPDWVLCCNEGGGPIFKFAPASGYFEPVVPQGDCRQSASNYRPMIYSGGRFYALSAYAAAADPETPAHNWNAGALGYRHVLVSDDGVRWAVLAQVYCGGSDNGQTIVVYNGKLHVSFARIVGGNTRIHWFSMPLPTIRRVGAVLVEPTTTNLVPVKQANTDDSDMRLPIYSSEWSAGSGGSVTRIETDGIRHGGCVELAYTGEVPASPWFLSPTLYPLTANTTYIVSAYAKAVPVSQGDNPMICGSVAFYHSTNGEPPNIWYGGSLSHGSFIVGTTWTRIRSQVLCPLSAGHGAKFTIQPFFNERCKAIRVDKIQIESAPLTGYVWRQSSRAYEGLACIRQTHEEWGNDFTVMPTVDPEQLQIVSPTYVTLRNYYLNGTQSLELRYEPSNKRFALYAKAGSSEKTVYATVANIGVSWDLMEPLRFSLRYRSQVFTASITTGAGSLAFSDTIDISGWTTAFKTPGTTFTVITGGATAQQVPQYVIPELDMWYPQEESAMLLDEIADKLDDLETKVESIKQKTDALPKLPASKSRLWPEEPRE